MKKLYIVFALVVMLSLTMGASALEFKTITRENGVAAFAAWSNEIPDATERTSLGVMKNDDGTDIFVEICKEDITGNVTCMFGFTFTQKDVFNMGRNLGTATLSPVVVDLFNFTTGEVERTITMQANWTGVGDVTRSSSRSMSKFGDFTSKFSDNVIFREATATGSDDGKDLGTSIFAEMSKFRRASMSMEK